ncbi:uncharacterized protein LOC101855746 [Aplysia californica]|uniref:Uncharacterized protein LOC101855746 n=1 Tax=Aplysia californica TaxID=6500 RepID=A0ABM1A8G2_APLCA|nr:uncharacterized protein LOC101855746 [Aplysia californica]
MKKIGGAPEPQPQEKEETKEAPHPYRTPSYWALFEAIAQGDAEVVKEVLDSKTDPQELLRKKDLQGLTPLKKSVVMSKAEIARLLVLYGAEPSVRDPIGKTALHTAATQGSRDLMAPLLVSPDSSVNVQDSFGWTPLHYAVRGKHKQAVDWLLFLGADVNIKNNEDKTPVEMCPADSPMMSVLTTLETRDPEEEPIQLCSGYVNRKQLSHIGPDSGVMFVTSDLWPRQPQFLLNVRIRPESAVPPIPLRQDELCFEDVNHYRLMCQLPEGKTRVKVYFTVFEELSHSELVMKITSKRRYLGEVPVLMSTFSKQSYTNYLACADLDLKNEGQYVLVKRPVVSILYKDVSGVLSTPDHPMFMINVPEGVLPLCPEDWEQTRRDRARQEADDLMTPLLQQYADRMNNLVEEEDADNTKPEEEGGGGGEEEDTTSTAGQPGTEEGKMEKKNTGENKNENKNPVKDTNDNKKQSEANVKSGKDSSAGEKKGGGKHKEEEEVEEEEEEEVEECVMVEGREADRCEDFYYISRGWGVYLKVQPTIDPSLLLEQPEPGQSEEVSVFHCCTAFYTVTHSSGQHPTQDCMLQMPKTPDFKKTGTVLVFMRKNLGPDEQEFPDPDDLAEETFLAEDGKSSKFEWWLARERDRWSLLPSGLANKQTRIVFRAHKFTTYIGVQLTVGSDKWEPELAGDSSDDSSGDDDDDDDDDDEGDDGEDGEDGGEAEDGEGGQGEDGGEAEDGEGGGEEGDEDDGEKKKKKKKKHHKKHRKTLVEEEEEGGDGEKGENDEREKKVKIAAEGESDKGEKTAVKGGGAQPAAEPDAPAPSPQGSTAELKTNKSANKNIDDDDSDSTSYNDDDDNNNSSSNNNKHQIDNNNSANTKQSLTPATGSGRHAPKVEEPPPGEEEEEEEEGEDDPLTFLAPEQRTLYLGMEPIGSSFASLVPRPPAVEEETEPVEAESDEELPTARARSFSIATMMGGRMILEDCNYGPALTSLHLEEVDMEQLTTEVAIMWRYRNHLLVVICAFVKARPDGDNSFDLVLEMVQQSDLAVRAEVWLGLGYKMVTKTDEFPSKSGRLFCLNMVGTVFIDGPNGCLPGAIKTEWMYYYSCRTNVIEMVVRIPPKEEPKAGLGKKAQGKKKDEKAAEVLPDLTVEIEAFPCKRAGSRVNGKDVVKWKIYLNTPDVWYDSHVALRERDDVLLDKLVKALHKSEEATAVWWKIWILLGYTEAEMEVEKVKQDWPAATSKIVKRWFVDNMDSNDRGILRLLHVLAVLELTEVLDKCISLLKIYKVELQSEQKKPRYLKMLFHWVQETKMTERSLMRLIEPDILQPISDIYLLLLANLLPGDATFDLGASMEVEENVLYTVENEENIMDPSYKPFRVLVKSRQKNDEPIHYIMLLVEMVKQLELPEARAFVVKETRKWMETIMDKEPDMCVKLENVLPSTEVEEETQG